MPSFHLTLPIKCGRHMTPLRLTTIKTPHLDLPPHFASLSLHLSNAISTPAIPIKSTAPKHILLPVFIAILASLPSLQSLTFRSDVKLTLAQNSLSTQTILCYLGCKDSTDTESSYSFTCKKKIPAYLSSSGIWHSATWFERWHSRVHKPTGQAQSKDIPPR